MYEDVLDLFIRRRSIRSYCDKPVEKEKIDTILKAAFAAPSTCNNQPWEMIVVTEKAIMDEIRAAFKCANYNAPCAIIVCANTHLCRNIKGMYIFDCSAAMENILLCATALELGSLWVGVYGESPIKSLAGIVGLPEHVVPCGIAYIGYPNEVKEARKQFDNDKRVYDQVYDTARKHKARPKNKKALGAV
jgi:Nitroreductase